ncbi:O-antigen ligase family protein [Actinopolymorpha alba]|uniref:O-antigen ligase family protein n=1 Tax=Actinopolymorpha alba TaxID=533267 RepID=UPI00036C56F8|nr:O-antigen ligase family protein [Actinopolymorpha alba]
MLAGVAAAASVAPPVATIGGAVVGALILLMRLPRLRLGAPDLLAAALCVLAALSIVWALDPLTTWYTVRGLLASMAIFFAVRAVITHRRPLVVVAWGYLVGCIAAVGVVLRENSGAEFALTLSSDRYGIAGVNVNNLAYALATGVVIVVLLWRIHEAAARWVKVLLIGAAAAMTFGIIQSGCRGALIGVVVTIAWLPAQRLVRRSGITVLCVGISLIAGVLSSGIGTTWLVALDAMSVRSSGDLTYRLILWPLARQTFGENWLLGIGAGGFSSLPPLWLGAHNVVLEIGSGLGIVGLAIFVAVIGASLVTSTRLAPDRGLVVGSLLVCWTPMWLSAHWELEPALWLVLAVFSRIAVLAPAQVAGERAEGSALR